MRNLEIKYAALLVAAIELAELAKLVCGEAEEGRINGPGLDVIAEKMDDGLAAFAVIMALGLPTEEDRAEYRAERPATGATPESAPVPGQLSPDESGPDGPGRGAAGVAEG